MKGLMVVNSVDKLHEPIFGSYHSSSAKHKETTISTIREGILKESRLSGEAS